MQSKAKTANSLEPDPRGVSQAAFNPEPWWRGFAYNALSSGLVGGNASISSSRDCPDGSESNDHHSQSNGGANDEDDVKRDTQATASSHSGTQRCCCSRVSGNFVRKMCMHSFCTSFEKPLCHAEFLKH